MEKLSKNKKIIGIFSALFLIILFFIIFMYSYFNNSFESINLKKIKSVKVFLTYYTTDGVISDKNSALSLNKIIPQNIYHECMQNAFYLDPLLYGTGVSSVELPKKPSAESKCDEYEKISIARTEPSLTIKIQNGKDFYDWLYFNPEFEKIRSSEVFKGYMSNYSDLTNVTGVELGIQKISQPFFKLLVKEILETNPVIFYDTIRGRNGIVLEFDSQKASGTRKSLVSLTSKFAKKLYNLADSKVKIWEIHLATHKFYLTEVNNKISISFNIIALINSIENINQIKQDKSNNEETLNVKLRLESYFNDLLPVLLGSKTYQPQFSFKLNKTQTIPLDLSLEKTKFFEIFTPSFSDGVLKSIPHDVFFAFATSISMPNPINVDKLIQSNSLNVELFKLQKKKSGVAVLWDLNLEKNNNLSDIGLIIADNKFESEEGFPIEDLVDSSLYHVEYCSPGNVHLMATSINLLHKMSTACHSQNKSILNWKAEVTKNFIDKQIILAVNLKTFFKTTFLNASHGLLAKSQDKNKEKNPSWKNESVREIEELKNETINTINKLPIFGFYGLTNENKLNGFSLLNEEF